MIAFGIMPAHAVMLPEADGDVTVNTGSAGSEVPWSDLTLTVPVTVPAVVPIMLFSPFG